MTRWLRLDQEGFVVSHRWWRFTPAPMSFRQPKASKRTDGSRKDRHRTILSGSALSPAPRWVDSEGGQPVV